MSIENSNTCKGEIKGGWKEEREVWRKIEKRETREERKKKKKGRREKNICDYKSSIIKRETSDLGLKNKLED